MQSSLCMANPMEAQLVIRVPQALVEQLAKYAEHLSDEHGLPVSQAAALRRLIAEGLNRAGFGIKRAAKKKASKKGPEAASGAGRGTKRSDPRAKRPRAS